MTTHAESADEPQPSLAERLGAEAPALRAYLKRVIGAGRGAADADDVAQEALARALRYRGSYDPTRPLGAWLRGVALRVLLDHQAKSALAHGASHEQAAEAAARHDSSLEQRDELEHALAPLSRLERELLVRFHARGESIRELARALELPEGTVKSHLHRARRRLVELNRKEDPR